MLFGLVANDTNNETGIIVSNLSFQASWKGHSNQFIIMNKLGNYSLSDSHKSLMFMHIRLLSR